MTPKQAQTLDAVRAHRDRTGIAPTRLELGKALGRSESAVHDSLIALKRQGVLAWDPGRPRTLVVIADAISPSTIRALTDDALALAAAEIASEQARRAP